MEEKNKHSLGVCDLCGEHVDSMNKLYGVMRVYPNGKHHSLVERVFDDYDTAEDYADYAEDLPDSFAPFTFKVVEILLD